MASLLLVEDHTLVRAGIRSLIESSRGGHQIVAEAATGLAAVRAARSLHPELAIVDVMMPEMNGIEAARLILEVSPASRVLMLSMHPDPAYVQAAFQAGAAGYVLKDVAFSELEAAIRVVLSGKRYLSTQVRRDRALQDSPTWGPASASMRVLSRRERQILQMVGEAFSSREIAEKLRLKSRTVETYRQNMMNKLGIHSVAALTAFALRNGLCVAGASPKKEASCIIQRP